jgi:hypothetical protein
MKKFLGSNSGIIVMSIIYSYVTKEPQKEQK